MGLIQSYFMPSAPDFDAQVAASKEEITEEISSEEAKDHRQGFGLKVDKKRLPITYRKNQMDDDVMDYLKSANIFTCSEKELVQLGFEACVDHTELPNHKYYEGYFHGLEASTPVDSINPRYGHMMQKPAAPPQLRAFAVAFRKINDSWIKEAISCNEHLKQLYDQGYVFADFAVQQHFGVEVTGKHLNWHRDAYNSILHLAMAIQGSRALNTKESATAKEDAKLVVDWQKVGAAYVSSPFAMMHAVTYRKCSWKDRIIAVQLRILLGPDSKTLHSKNDFQENSVDIMTAVSAVLAKADVKLPTMQDIKEAEASMNQHQSSYAE